MRLKNLLLIRHKVSTALTTAAVVELRVQLLRGRVEGPRPSYRRKILVLELSQSVLELLVLLTQSDVLPFDTLELFDPHL